MSLVSNLNSAFAQIGTDIGAIKDKTDFITITQAVDLDAIESRVNALDQSVILKGTFDPSGGVFPGGGTAQAGESWIASGSGTIGGMVINTNDRVIAITDNAGTTTAANWHLADYTDNVLSVNGRTGAVTGLQEASAIGDTATNFLSTYTTARDA